MQHHDGIFKPHEHDVLSGRGNFVNYHSGNEHFRTLVRKHKVAYVACPKPQKGKFSKMIVDEIKNRNPPGRFLKQDMKTKLWYDIGEKKALDKTRQALREGAPVIMKELHGDEEEEGDMQSGSNSSSGPTSSSAHKSGVPIAPSSSVPPPPISSPAASTPPLSRVMGYDASMAGFHGYGSPSVAQSPLQSRTIPEGTMLQQSPLIHQQSPSIQQSPNRLMQQSLSSPLMQQSSSSPNAQQHSLNSFHQNSFNTHGSTFSSVHEAPATRGVMSHESMPYPVMSMQQQQAAAQHQMHAQQGVGRHHSAPLTGMVNMNNYNAGHYNAIDKMTMYNQSTMYQDQAAYESAPTSAPMNSSIAKLIAQSQQMQRQQEQQHLRQQQQQLQQQAQQHSQRAQHQDSEYGETLAPLPPRRVPVRGNTRKEFNREASESSLNFGNIFDASTGTLNTSDHNKRNNNSTVSIMSLSVGDMQIEDNALAPLFDSSLRFRERAKSGTPTGGPTVASVSKRRDYNPQEMMEMSAVTLGDQFGNGETSFTDVFDDSGIYVER